MLPEPSKTTGVYGDGKDAAQLLSVTGVMAMSNIFELRFTDL
jgi:hypothetical protein